MEFFGIFSSKSALLLLSVAGALSVLLIRQSLAVHNNRCNVLRSAVHTFKSAFSDCASAIANNSFAIDTFARDFDRHMAAADAIRPLLRKRHQRKLQKGMG